MLRREILAKVQRQQEFWQENTAGNAKISLNERKNLLESLKRNIKAMEPEIYRALRQDLNKSETESYMTEVGLVLGEISYMQRHLKKFARAKRVYTPFANFPARSRRLAAPRGRVLIISPWNYPFLLTMQPLVDAISAGNTVILKPSEYSPHTSRVMQELVERTFRPEIATTVLGGVVECTILLDQDFDYIFYTGSTRVGEIVMKKAAKHFTPVTLEMGGKSPCIVDETANLRLAARRIVFGKLLNAGQTCVAPDYIFCQSGVKEQLVEELKREIARQYTVKPLENPEYPRIVNQSQFRAMCRLIEPEKVIFGGRADAKNLKIEPTLVEADFGDKCMKREIFGPILPIVTFETLDEVVQKVNQMAPPLALYLFSRSRKRQKMVLEKCKFGGGCVNDTVMHLANNRLGFGGVRQSGIGEYHGEAGFRTFSHYKSVLDKANWLDLPMRYQPFSRLKVKLIKLFLR